MSDIAKLRDMIASSGRIVFFGGAGVSTESGIPDFRSENGIYDAIRRFGERPETLLSHTFFMANTGRFYEYYRSALLVTDVVPNDAHVALAELERQGKLTAVVTQNIDGLHTKAGSKNVFELHGSIYRNYCMDCRRAYSAEDIMKMDTLPRCSCGGVIKPDVVLYEEGLDSDVLRGAMTHIMRADMLIIGGTSLAVYPAAGLIDYYRGNKLVLINKSRTPCDSRADLVIHEPIGKVLREAVLS
ncbi:MAG: NAD-dependent protein deacylase [Clostridia bacterium]|nr:NAD-dependent protein deacylase [Clostridia bacterium]MBQ4610201.1 NAD-dependent protein deacylase [Clostridia bacterium]MBQ6703508.1 NAD-dependent protein deacylase [Clostridia bacterium]